MPTNDQQPYRGATWEERIELLRGAIAGVKEAVESKDYKVRAAVLMGLMNDRCDPIWKRLKKVVSKTEIDFDDLAIVARAIIG
jgi:hypothetical protein